MDGSLSDESLIEKVAEGDTFAFQTIIERYQSLAINTAYRFIGNRHDAEDIAQEAFLRLYHHANSYRPIAKFKTWFFRILTNLCLDFCKKKRPEYREDFPEVSSKTPIPSEALESLERQKKVQQAIQELKENQRMALVLHQYDGLQYQEIAETIGCSVKAVESLLVRAKKALKEKLADLL